MGVGELPEEARLADARLADDGRELASAAAGKLEGVAEQVQLRIAADEARETAGGRGLQSRAHGCGPDDLVDLDRGGALDRHRAERRDLHVPFREGQADRLGTPCAGARDGVSRSGSRWTARIADTPCHRRRKSLGRACDGC